MTKKSIDLKSIPLNGPMVSAIYTAIRRETAVSGRRPDRLYITYEQWAALEIELGLELRDLTLIGVPIRRQEFVA